MRALLLPEKLRSFLPAQDGTTAIEYALIAGGIAVVLIGSIGSLGNSVAELWAPIGNLFN